MIDISLTFPAGRYHATPWGRHVNEGAVEWPPSPWRILRALIATWKRTLPNMPQEEVEPILRALAGSPPVFALPPAATGHTRHYMPWFKKGPEDRTLVFDTFVVVPRDAALLIRWPGASLDGDRRNTLDAILQNLSTLGRAESWCEAKLLSDQESVAAADHATAQPLNGDDPGANQEIIRLLCPDPESALADDHVVTVKTKTSGRGRNRQTIEERATIYDPAWNICMETLQLHRGRWSDPPGSRWVQYTRPRDCFTIEPVRTPRPRSNRAPAPQVVRFALDSSVLPLVTDTLPVAEAARAALQCLYGEAGRGRARDRRSLDRCVSAHVYGTAGRGAATEQERSVIFSGHEPSGAKCEGHCHAYYLPTAEGEGERDRLTHLTLVARDGFGPEEMRAIHRLCKIRPRGRDNASHPLRVLLLGYGRLNEYQPPPVEPSREWISATPYIATRHAKARGRCRIDLHDWQARTSFLIDDLRRQLAVVRPDFTCEASDWVDITPEFVDGRFQVAGRRRPIQFKRSRAKSGDDGGRRMAGAFRLKFPDEVPGPIALGRGAHFGMGLFMPEQSGR